SRSPHRPRNRRAEAPNSDAAAPRRSRSPAPSPEGTRASAGKKARHRLKTPAGMPNGDAPVLFVPQRNHRVHFHRPPRWNVTSKQDRAGNEDRDAQVDQRIARVEVLHVVPQHHREANRRIVSAEPSVLTSSARYEACKPWELGS